MFLQDQIILALYSRIVLVWNCKYLKWYNKPYLHYWKLQKQNIETHEFNKYLIVFEFFPEKSFFSVYDWSILIK